MVMPGRVRLIAGLLVLLVSGCASSVRTPAPVTDRDQGASPARPALERPAKPAPNTVPPAAPPRRAERPSVPAIILREDDNVGPRDGRWPASGQEQPQPVAPPETPAVQASRAPAVVALVQRAQGLSERGDVRRAVAALERALRLEPRNPRLWHELARLRCTERRYDACESLAAKSARLDRGRDLEQRNWALIAVARAGRGDAQGARDARQRASGGE